MKNTIFKIRINHLLLVFLSLYCIESTFAQYSGGSGDGFDSNNSSITNFSEIANFSIPSAPVAIEASQVQGYSFIANWEPSPLATRYFLDVDDNNDFSSPISGFNNLDLGYTHSYTVSGLNPNQTYYYRVRANNSLGTSANSNIIDVTTTQNVLTIEGLSVKDKPYDGTTYASLDGMPELVGIEGSDDVNLITANVVAHFNDEFVGEEKPVTVSGFAISGDDIGAYNLVQPAGLTGNIFKATPEIIWLYPEDIESGTPLSETQLNASTNVEGDFSYDPPAGTILEIGNSQELSVEFVPNDVINYNSSYKTVYINVIQATTNLVNSENNELIIYPNPVNNKIILENLSFLSGGKAVIIKIFDATGKILLDYPCNEDKLRIDMKNFTKGLYFINFQIGTKKITKLIMKN